LCDREQQLTVETSAGKIRVLGFVENQRVLKYIEEAAGLNFISI
jgi:hypothetical protein